MTRRAETPPREWVEEHFVRAGQITYCTDCGAVPAVPMGTGHDCMRLGAEAHFHGLLGEWATMPCDFERLVLVENGDRPGDWMPYVRDPKPVTPVTRGGHDEH